MNNYEKAYQKLLNQPLEIKDLLKFIEQNSRSLKTHIDKVLEQFSEQRFPGLNYNAIELGCGGGGITSYLEIKGFKATGLDISKSAIELALKLKAATNQNTRFIVFDVCQDIELTEKFELMVDGHLLHCLTDPKKRNLYYQFIRNNLSDTGLFLGECMSFHRDLKIPVEYELDENSVLLHNGNPIRILLEARELEKELALQGFKIEYFYYHSELSFEVYTDYPDFPLEYLPKTIRFAASSK